MTGILDELIARVRTVEAGLQSGSLVRGVVERHEADILDLQREQLLQGKTSSGEDLRPYYSEDTKPGGYFRTTDSARRYAAWKQTLSYPSFSGTRNPDAPNLYINGQFHNDLGVQFGPDAVSVVGETPAAQKIIAKYGAASFGLAPDAWSTVFTERGALSELMEQINDLIYV